MDSEQSMQKVIRILGRYHDVHITLSGHQNIARYALAEVPRLTAEESNDLTGACYQRRLGVSTCWFLTSATWLQA